MADNVMVNFVILMCLFIFMSALVLWVRKTTINNRRTLQIILSKVLVITVITCAAILSITYVLYLEMTATVESQYFLLLTIVAAYLFDIFGAYITKVIFFVEKYLTHTHTLIKCKCNSTLRSIDDYFIERFGG